MFNKAIHEVLCAALVCLGLMQTYGAFTQNGYIRFAALGTAASPLPDVFGSAQGVEPMSLTRVLRFTDAAGTDSELPLNRGITPMVYSHWGHIVRFGAYIAALQWLPVIDHRAAKDILSHGLCRAGPLAQALGLPDSIQTFEVVTTDRNHTLIRNGQLQVSCEK